MSYSETNQSQNVGWGMLLSLLLAALPVLNTPPVRVCTTVLIPEVNVTVKNERGLMLNGAEIHITHESDGVAIRVSAHNYQPSERRGIHVPRTPDGCHPMTQQVTVTLHHRPNAPAVRDFRLLGHGQPFLVYLDALPAIQQKGVTWSINRSSLGRINAKTGVFIPACLPKRDWVKITATLNADSRQQTSQSFEIPLNMQGCQN